MHAFQTQITTLTAQVTQLTADCAAYRKLYLETLETCKRLEQGLLAQKRERLSEDDSQLTLSLLGMLLSKETPLPPQEDKRSVKAHDRKKPTGRKSLPENLPRVEVELLPPEVEQEGKAAFEQIGCETSETIERRPASTVIVRVLRPKFVRKDKTKSGKTTVLCEAPPELPISRGLAGPGMLADTIVKRWQDHLPLYRQEQIYAREGGLELSRSTICQWHGELAELCKPLCEAMKQDAYQAPYLCTDATGVLVQAKDKCRRGHFWVLIAPERHVLFFYSKQHNKEAAAVLLADYQGYVVADAHTVYDHLFVTGERIEVGCWSHTRRYFFKAMTTAPQWGKEGLAFINALFRIERSIKTSPRKKRREARMQSSAPIMDDFFAWCVALKETVVDESPIAKAIGYALNQEQALRQCLNDERLPIHNNWSEGQLRREAVGRKNWIFLGSDDGGDVNATFVTLLASCQMHGIEPWAYLRDLFCLLPDWPVADVLALSPLHWRKTIERDDVKSQLSQNIFRRATLANQ